MDQKVAPPVVDPQKAEESRRRVERLKEPAPRKRLRDLRSKKPVGRHLRAREKQRAERIAQIEAAERERVRDREAEERMEKMERMAKLARSPRMDEKGQDHHEDEMDAMVQSLARRSQDVKRKKKIPLPPSAMNMQDAQRRARENLQKRRAHSDQRQMSADTQSSIASGATTSKADQTAALLEKARQIDAETYQQKAPLKVHRQEMNFVNSADGVGGGGSSSSSSGGGGDDADADDSAALAKMENMYAQAIEEQMKAIQEEDEQQEKTKNYTIKC